MAGSGEIAWWVKSFSYKYKDSCLDSQIQCKSLWASYVCNASTEKEETGGCLELTGQSVCLSVSSRFSERTSQKLGQKVRKKHLCPTHTCVCATAHMWIYTGTHLHSITYTYMYVYSYAYIHIQWDKKKGYVIYSKISKNCNCSCCDISPGHHGRWLPRTSIGPWKGVGNKLWKAFKKGSALNMQKEVGRGHGSDS